MVDVPRCKDYRPDHNGECLTCDEPASEHDLPDVVWLVARVQDLEREVARLKGVMHDMAVEGDARFERETTRLEREVARLTGQLDYLRRATAEAARYVLTGDADADDAQIVDRLFGNRG